jgi:hypothetical protein
MPGTGLARNIYTYIYILFLNNNTLCCGLHRSPEYELLSNAFTFTVIVQCLSVGHSAT